MPWDCSGEAYVPSGEIGGGREREREETVWDQKSYGRTVKMIRSGSKRATVVTEAQRESTAVSSARCEARTWTLRGRKDSGHAGLPWLHCGLNAGCD